MIALALTLLSIPLLLPIISWVMTRRLRRRVADMEARLAAQQSALLTLTSQVERLRKDLAATTAPIATAPATRAPAAARPADATAPGVAPRVSPAAPAPIRAAAERPPAPAVAGPHPSAVPPPPPQPPPPSRRSPEPPSQPPAPTWSFDWEQLVGVRLFAAIAGIALVVAAVFFLRYSIDHGWLQPAVRAAIGVLAGLALLVGCEVKAARKYPATANALDAAAIAILFATFFAAHALWNLIPATVAFALLALVTATAVALSIRRESLFIAVLGLLGGFATPALLSTGENRPIPLFAYLLLLNIGLAWVAYQRGWAVLSVLTLLFTTLYQWGWVVTFLAARDIPLALGIFIVFPAVGVGMFTLARAHAGRREAGGQQTFEWTALAAAVLPLLFVTYLASVPAFGERYLLLFGYLLVVDAGLLAIALGLGRQELHAVGAVATVLVFGVWLGTSYAPGLALPIAGFVALFSALYLAAPSIATRCGRPLGELADHARYAAPALLFVFPVLAAIEPAAAAPLPLFGALFALLAVLAWRAIATGEGGQYYLAAFFALAAEAVWSVRFLTPDRLPAALGLFTAFAAVYMGVPHVARTGARPLAPGWAGGAVLLASVLLLLFLAAGPTAAAGLWGLAFLLAILNAAIFIESAVGTVPRLSTGGSLVSWGVLFVWWARSAGAIGLLPSLLFVVGLSLVTVGGHAWLARHRAPRGDAGTLWQARPAAIWIPLLGHLFLVAIALSPEWALPPWPLFGALAVMTLAMSVAALATGQSALHFLSLVAAAGVVLVWRQTAPLDAWAGVGAAAFAALTAFSLASIRAARRTPADAAMAAAAVVVITELSTMATTLAVSAPPLALLIATHVIALTLLLALVRRFEWAWGASATAGLAALALLLAGAGRDRAWPSLLVHAVALYAPLAAYPFALGRSQRGARDPYIAALIAGAAALLAGRQGMIDGGYEWMVGLVPITIGAVTTLHLRQLLRLEPAGARDIGRLALVAGASLAFLTVAIPMQLDEQWITIGWALEGAALAWLYTRVPHRGLLYASMALLGAVFVRLALNPEVFVYEPRGTLRILNWYLYTYALAAAAMGTAAWWFSRTDDAVAPRVPRPRHLLPAGAVILLFLLLNIEIADFHATGPEIVFRTGVSIAQDLTYTIAWLAFALAVLAGGIVARSRHARMAAVALITVTTLKCFLYDLSSLEGLYRVGAFLGLAFSLALVSLVLQKYVLARKNTTGNTTTETTQPETLGETLP